MKQRSFFLLSMSLVGVMSFGMDPDLFFGEKYITNKWAVEEVEPHWVRIKLPGKKKLENIFKSNGLDDFAVQTDIIQELAYHTMFFGRMVVIFALAVADYDKKQQNYRYFNLKVNWVIAELYDKYQI